MDISVLGAALDLAWDADFAGGCFFPLPSVTPKGKKEISMENNLKHVW